MTLTRTATRTRTPTPSLPPGPKITFFGLATADNRVITPVDATVDGIPIYTRPNPFGFLLVVEGRPGSSGRPLGQFGTMEQPSTGVSRPDVQVLASRSLGNGSTNVCDVGPLPALLGGIPSVAALMFDESQSTTDALNDFACRFDVHDSAMRACTLDELGNFAYASPEVSIQTRQFCTAPAVGKEMQFPSGDTTLIVQLRDTSGNLGNTAKIIVRVP